MLLLYLQPLLALLLLLHLDGLLLRRSPLTHWLPHGGTRSELAARSLRLLQRLILRLLLLLALLVLRQRGLCGLRPLLCLHRAGQLAVLRDGQQELRAA
jgi:hypothetical protein